MGGSIVLIIVFGAGIFANYIAPYSFEQIDLNQRPAHRRRLRSTTSAPTRSAATTSAVCVYGIRTSEEVGLFVAIVSTIIGLVVGAIAGYFGGWLDNILMRVTDLVLTLPALAILLTAAALLGTGSQWRVSSSSRFFFWTTHRAHRARHLPLAAREGVRRGGQGGRRGRPADHVPPHPPEHARADRRAATLAVGAAILVEAALSFLGFGIKPPTPVARRARRRRARHDPQKWWLTIFPGLMIVADRPLHQLHRRRPARRARSAAAESPCLSRSSRSATSPSSSRPRTASSTPSTASPTTSIRARRSASSASRARARASARCRSSA